MKICPKCQQTYPDDNQSFCYNDGEVLNVFEDDAPPTIMMDAPRVTNQTNWQQSQYQPPPFEPPVPWQSQTPKNVNNQQFGVSPFNKQQDQTLPTVSLVLGILSFVFICCYGGFWLGIPAAVVGFLGMQNADKDPQKYGGRGMAIAGMIIGGISLLVGILFLLLGIASNF